MPAWAAMQQSRSWSTRALTCRDLFRREIRRNKVDDLEFLFYFCVDADHALICRVQRFRPDDIQSGGQCALCTSEGDRVSRGGTVATEPNAIEIAEINRVKPIYQLFPVPGSHSDSVWRCI